MSHCMAIAVFAVSLVFGQAVHAAVLITALPNPLNLRDDLNVSYEVIDVDANGSVDFTFGYDFFSVGFRTELANRFIYVFAPPPNLGGAVASLQAPFVIQTTLDSSTVLWGSSDPVEGYVTAGEFSFATVVLVLDTGSSSGFSGRGAIGIEFAAPDGIHYGYIDIDAGPGYAGITLFGWAYESRPGVGITAGQVPEPSSLFLTLLSLAPLVLRRRRIANSE